MRLTYRGLVSHYGRHRARPTADDFPPAPRASVVTQAFVHCPACGVETAATVHGAALRCAEGHLVPAGGA